MIALMAIRHFTEDGCLCFPANCYFSLSSSSLSLTTPEDGDILIDFSKNRVTKETMKLLFDLVREKRMYRPIKVIKILVDREAKGTRKNMSVSEHKS